MPDGQLKINFVDEPARLWTSAMHLRVLEPRSPGSIGDHRTTVRLGNYGDLASANIPKVDRIDDLTHKARIPLYRIVNTSPVNPSPA